MAVNNYNKEHMKLVEKALNIYDDKDETNIAGEAYFTGFRDAVYNKAKGERSPFERSI